MEDTIKKFYTGAYEQNAIRGNEIYLQRTLDYLKKKRNWTGCKSLDIGCDKGDFSVQLQKLGFETYGTDIRKNVLKEAQKAKVKTRLCDLEKRFPFKDNSFDLLFAGEIIEHLFDTDHFIKECKRVMKPGGILIVTTPNIASLVNRVSLLFGKTIINNSLYDWGVGHIRFYSFPALKRQLELNGLSVVNEFTNNFPFLMSANIPVFLKKLAIKLSFLFHRIGYQIIMVAKKRK